MRRPHESLKSLPSEAKALVELLPEGFKTILGSNLQGIYLYGSLTMGAFNPDTSDIDCVVVVGTDLDDREYTAVGEWLERTGRGNPWVARLDMQILPREAILTQGPAICRFNGGRLSRCNSDGNPVIWLNMLDCGIVLLGPADPGFIPPVTGRAIADCLVREIGYLAEGIALRSQTGCIESSYATYAVFTLCRILYTHRHGSVVSKAHAAEWSVTNLPGEWQPLIESARAGGYIADDNTPGTDTELQRFLDFTNDELSKPA